MIAPNITKQIIVSDTLIVSVAELGLWLNLSSSAITAHTDLITSLIVTATEVIEDYTWLSLRRKTFEAYYDLQESTFFSVLNHNEKLSLERSPIIDIADITKIEYLANDIWNVFDRGTMSIDGLYEKTSERIIQRDWASVYFIEQVPFEERINAYKIRITFLAGWDAAETETAFKIPEKLKTAIKMIAAFHHTNRGDCESKCSLNSYPVPCAAKGMIDQIAISNTVLGSESRIVEDYYGY